MPVWLIGLSCPASSTVLLVLQGKAAQAQPAQESPHAEAVISQVGSNSRKANNGSEGSKGHDSSPDSAQKLHPTRSRRLSHIYTAEVSMKLKNILFQQQ